ncbi:cuticle protein AM1199-like [Penaeus indicus]|uniref:cuticle protein AM1199-like n=1 Tax=Penaeus indicus TaxID=29960 RepID=UPI00300C684F
MFSKLILCVAATAVGAARLGYSPSQGRAPGGGAAGFRPSGPQVPILRDDRQGPDEFGNYNFNFETGDGISRQEQGAPQPPVGAVASQGGWSFTFPDGTPARFSFTADGEGYRVESDLLPTPPPLPAHAIAQIEKARREDAAGGSGNRFSSGSGSGSQFGGSQFGSSRPSAPRPGFQSGAPGRNYRYP